MKDKPTTTWYYDYYEPRAFPNQQKLCEKVMWTECNLEGQRLVPTTLIKRLGDGTEKEIRTIKLTGERANPLTIRLFGVREALNKLESEINQTSKKIIKQAAKQFSKGEVFELAGERITSSSTAVETGGAPVDKIIISGEEQPLQVPHVRAHLLLYELFTNFGSIMDRLAYEINLLYGLKVRNVDWSRLVNTSPSRDQYLKALSSKDSKLGDFVSGLAPWLEKAIRYRNRLVHDGIIRIDVISGLIPNRGTVGLSVRLAQDPNDNDSPMNVDALEFCKKTKAEILKLLDGSYELMLQRGQTLGAPPW